MPSRTCGICGAPCRPPFQAPPPELAPDLDLRPGEPTRSTLPRWVATCRSCGATAPDLATLPPRLKPMLETPEYLDLAGPGPQQPFLRWAMLAEAESDHLAAAQATLEAAWTLDDAGQDAATLRRRAAALWGEPETAQDALRLVDVLRRAGQFPAARERAEAALSAAREDTDRAVLRFQLGLIGTGDAGRHLLSSALRPPAHTPHVTHGRAPKHRSFWQRITGS